MTDTEGGEDEILAELAELTVTMRERERDLEVIRDQRIVLLRRGRALDLTYARLAEAMGVTNAAVQQALKKAQRADERSAETEQR